MTARQVALTLIAGMFCFTAYKTFDSYMGHEAEIKQAEARLAQVRYNKQELEYKKHERRIWAKVLENANSNIPVILDYAKQTQADNIAQIAKYAVGAEALQYGSVTMDQEKLRQMNRNAVREKATITTFENTFQIFALDFKTPRLVKIAASRMLQSNERQEITIQVDRILDSEDYDIFWNAMKNKTPMLLQVTESKTKKGSIYRLESFKRPSL